MNTTAPGAQDAISLFLLKTKANPGDGYEEQFASVKDGIRFEPVFVPVLEHKFKEKGMRTMRNMIRRDRFGTHEGSKYGGLIFTSQRAVEAFTSLTREEEVTGQGAQEAAIIPTPTSSSDYHHPSPETNILPDYCAFAENGTWKHIQEVPVYSVGPVTTRALRAIQAVPNLQIFGSETGNGEALARFILDHYADWYRDLDERPPLLFVVGEQRRDIIPEILMSPDLGLAFRTEVHEVIVYETGVMESFGEDFGALLRRTEGRPARWVVVFSPTGTEAMLRALDMLDPRTGRARADMSRDRRRTYVATIGPTTRDHLREQFGFDPDVCAEKPSPEGVEDGIRKFMKGLRL